MTGAGPDPAVAESTHDGPRSGTRRPCARPVLAAAILAAAALAAIATSGGGPGGERVPASTAAPVALPGFAPPPAAPPPAASGPASTGPATTPATSPAANPAAAPPAGSLPVPAASAGAADPFVLSFAQQPGVTPQPPVASPTVAAPEMTTVDGCDHHYGSNPQCVPWTFPPAVTDKCGWLAGHGFGPLAVHGVDRQRLDTNGDGVACGPHD